MEEALTMPISQSRAGNSSNSSSTPAQPAQITARNSNPTNEETIVVPRRSSSKSRLGLAAAGIGLLLTGAAGAYFLSGGRSQSNVQNVAVRTDPTATPTLTSIVNSTVTPNPTVKPKPSPTVHAGVVVKPAPPAPPSGRTAASDLLLQAKSLEDSDKYAEAIAKYDEYQQTNPGFVNEGKAINRINLLSNVRRLLAEAQVDMQAGRYVAAREKYKNALRLKPISQAARAGFEEAKSKAPYPMNGPGRRSPQSPNGELPPPGQGRRRRFPNPNPDPPQQP